MHDVSGPAGRGPRDEKSDTRSTARLLQARGGADLFIFLAVTAADGRWADFTAAFSEVGDISENGMEVLLEQPEPSLGWTHLYHAAGLPRSLFKFFIRLVAIARQAARQPESAARRADVLAAARSSPEGREAPVPDALWKSLSAQ